MRYSVAGAFAVNAYNALFWRVPGCEQHNDVVGFQEVVFAGLKFMGRYG